MEKREKKNEKCKNFCDHEIIMVDTLYERQYAHFKSFFKLLQDYRVLSTIRLNARALETSTYF